MLEKMLKLVPSRRLTLEKCLLHPYFNAIYASKSGNEVLPNGNPYPPLFNYTIDGLHAVIGPNRRAHTSQSWHT